jgi:hypothetical protein
MQRTEPELERSVTEQLAKESGPASDALALRWRLRHWRPKGSIGLRPNAPHRELLRKLSCATLTGRDCGPFVTLEFFLAGQDLRQLRPGSHYIIAPDSLERASAMPAEIAAPLDACPICHTIYEIVRHHVRPPAEPVCETCQQVLPVADGNDWLTYRVIRSHVHVRRSGEPRS